MVLKLHREELAEFGLPLQWDLVFFCVIEISRPSRSFVGSWLLTFEVSEAKSLDLSKKFNIMTPEPVSNYITIQNFKILNSWLIFNYKSYYLGWTLQPVSQPFFVY